MINLEDLRMIRAVADSGSLAAAARLQDLTPPALTVRLRRLEKALGIHLAVRGARGITLTDEGRSLVAEAVAVLERVESIPERLGSAAHAMTGRLRVAAPLGFGREYMAAIVRDMHLTYPSLNLALQLSDSPLRDAAGCDAVIHIGTLNDSSWVKHLLAPNQRVLCASPAFVRRLGTPLVHPSQLQEQACLCLKENDEDLTRWRFTQRRSKASDTPKAQHIRVSGPLSSNDGAVVTQWALDGQGIMARSEWEAGPLIASGKLVRLLPDWEMEDAPVFALTPVRTGTSARLRLFIDACKQALQPVPWRS